MAIAWIFFRENVDRRVFAGAMAILAGALVLSWPADGAAMTVGWGGALIVAACICWGIDNNLTRKFSGADPVQIAMVKGVAAGVINTAAGLRPWRAAAQRGGLCRSRYRRFPRLWRQPRALRTGVTPSRCGPHRSVFFDSPFIGTALAVPLLGEPITWPLIAAAALMAAGVYLHLPNAHRGPGQWTHRCAMRISAEPSA